MATPSPDRSAETAALLQGVAAGDREAFERFYDLLAPVAFGVIRAGVRDRDAAAGVLQEVLWQVWREAGQYDPAGGSPEAWVVARARTRVAADHALASLEGEERARFEALLQARDPEALAELREFESTLAELTDAGPEPPPPAVKAALMARVAAGAPPTWGPVRPRVRKRRRRGRAVWPVVLSGVMAAGLAAIVVAWSVSSLYEKRLDALARDAAQLRAELRGQQGVIATLRDPATQVVTLAGLEPAPGARARVMWHPQAGGVFLATGLPAAPAGKTYQLWAITGDNASVSAGVFTVDAAGGGSLSVRPLPGVSRVSAFTVTLEPAGGLPAPSGAVHLLGKP